MRILLIGNYGVGNIGDEALKDYFLNLLKDHKVTVLSANPREGELYRLPIGIRSFFTTPWIRTLKAFYNTDGVVFGGGSLFTDVESVWAPILWGKHAFWARLFRKPIFMAFQGVGPLKTALGRALTGFAFKKAVMISVRDKASAEYLIHRYKNKKVVQSFDPIFRLFVDQKSLESSKKVFVVIPRNYSLQVAQNPAFSEVKILSLQPENSEEMEVCKKIQNSIGGIIIPIRSVEELTKECSTAGFVLSQRYHGALAALALGVPYEVVPVGENDKLAQLQDLKESKEELLEKIRVGEEAFLSALTK